MLSAQQTSKDNKAALLLWLLFLLLSLWHFYVIQNSLLSS